MAQFWIEIWLAQAAHILKDYHFFLKSFSEIWDQEEKKCIKKDTALPFPVESYVISHPIATNKQFAPYS